MQLFIRIHHKHRMINCHGVVKEAECFQERVYAFSWKGTEPV